MVGAIRVFVLFYFLKFLLFFFFFLYTRNYMDYRAILQFSREQMELPRSTPRFKTRRSRFQLKGQGNTVVKRF